MTSLKKRHGWLIGLTFLLLLVLTGALLFFRFGKGFRAERLYKAGNYSAARKLFLETGNTEGAERCDERLREMNYHRARQLMGSGDYRQALEILEELSGYQDSDRLQLTCRFSIAGDLVRSGDLDEAKEIYLALGDYPGCEEALQEMPPLYYDKALELAHAFQIDAACAIWEELGDFRNCEILLERGKRIQKMLADSSRTKLNDPSRAYINSVNGFTYISDEAYIVTPAVPNSDTRFLLYFPGGRDEELNLDFLDSYLMNPAPNTLAVFMRKNGLPDLAAGNRRALDLLEKAATDLGVFVDLPVVAGSSLGVYTAIQCPRVAWHGYGIQVSCVLSLDAGNDWWEPLLAPDEETALEIARIDTELYLFQSPQLSTEHPMIRRFVDAGDIVTVVECINDDHEQITLDALSSGVVGWALGDRSEPFRSDLFRFVSLS